jgi:hypothetical protein
VQNRSAVIAQIQRINITGGGIYIGPSVAAAEKVIRAETSKVRHMILLADGADSTDWRDAIPRAFGMRADKITTTVVAVGDGPHVPQLRQLAAAGGGRFYLATKAKQLPAIFTQDTAIMSRSAIEEGAFLPKIVSSDPILDGIDATPPLLAYCLTDSRPLAKVLMRTQKDDPLLAVWQYGLGSSLAFTSDAQARWAVQWLGWDGFGGFWAQAIRAISRRASDNVYDMRISQEGGKGALEVTAADRLGNPIDARGATVRVAMPNGESTEVVLSQEAPGKFRGSFPAQQLGTYIATIGEKDGRGGTRITTSGFSVAYPPEYRTSTTNRALLARASELGKGEELAMDGEMLRKLPNPGASIRELWPLFLLIAGLLLPLDIATRRLAIPLGEMMGKLHTRRRAAPEVATERVDRLQQAKRRAAPQQEPAVQIEPTTPVRKDVPKAAPGPSAPASQRLLEAKRKREGQ